MVTAKSASITKLVLQIIKTNMDSLAEALQAHRGLT